MQTVNLVFVAPNSTPPTKISFCNVHFEHEISIGKIFPFPKLGSGGFNQAGCHKKPQNL